MRAHDRKRVVILELIRLWVEPQMWKKKSTNQIGSSLLVDPVEHTTCHSLKKMGTKPVPCNISGQSC